MPNLWVCNQITCLYIVSNCNRVGCTSHNSFGNGAIHLRIPANRFKVDVLTVIRHFMHSAISSMFTVDIAKSMGLQSDHLPIHCQQL